jgi:hypothetical protein
MNKFANAMMAFTTLLVIFSTLIAKSLKPAKHQQETD